MLPAVTPSLAELAGYKPCSMASHGSLPFASRGLCGTASKPFRPFNQAVKRGLRTRQANHGLATIAASNRFHAPPGHCYQPGLCKRTAVSSYTAIRHADVTELLAQHAGTSPPASYMPFTLPLQPATYKWHPLCSSRHSPHTLTLTSLHKPFNHTHLRRSVNYLDSFTLLA